MGDGEARLNKDVHLLRPDAPDELRFFPRVLHSSQAETPGFPRPATLIQTVCHSRHGRPTVIGVSLKVIDGKDWARTVDTAINPIRRETPVSRREAFALALEAHFVYQNMS